MLLRFSASLFIFLSLLFHNNISHKVAIVLAFIMVFNNIPVKLAITSNNTSNKLLEDKSNDND